MSTGISFLLLFSFVSIRLACCHTWIDQLSLIDSNDQITGSPGFIRGYVQRLPGFTDVDVTYLLPISPSISFQDTDLMCMATQTLGNQTNGPALIAPGGSRIVLRYQENGHITQPWIPPNKPSPGSVYVYATTQAQYDDKFTAIHGQWTEDGLGGDQRGYLLNATTFDDGLCFQENSSEIANQRSSKFGPGTSPTEAPNRWCGTIITLNDMNGEPLQSGTLLTLYWVWDWPFSIPSAPGSSPTALSETYTSCMDVTIQ